MKWLILSCFIVVVAWGETSQAQEHVYTSKFTTIHYHHPDQLETFFQKIKPGAVTLSLNQLLIGGDTASPEERIGRRVDRICQRVQVILDMPKPSLHVIIRLYKDQDELSRACQEVMGQPSQVPAFYWNATNTIYLQIDKLSLGILSHEMAHAIIGQYFIISPPRKISELLCQYVDMEITKGNF